MSFPNIDKFVGEFIHLGCQKEITSWKHSYCLLDERRHALELALKKALAALQAAQRALKKNR